MTSPARSVRLIGTRARFGVGSDTQDDNTAPATDETPLYADSFGAGDAGDLTIDDSGFVIITPVDDVAEAFEAVDEYLDAVDDRLVALEGAPAPSGPTRLVQDNSQAAAGAGAYANTDLGFTATASHVYKIRAVLTYDLIPNGDSTYVKCDGSATAVTEGCASWMASGATGVLRVLTGVDAAAQSPLGTDAPGSCIIDAILTVGGTGGSYNLQLRSASTNTHLLIGSYLEYEDITP